MGKARHTGRHTGCVPAPEWVLRGICERIAREGIGPWLKNIKASNARGRIPCIVIDPQYDDNFLGLRDGQFFEMSDTMVTSMRTADPVTARWLSRVQEPDAPLRIFCFIQKGTLLLNLDLSVPSLEIEPGSTGGDMPTN